MRALGVVALMLLGCPPVSLIPVQGPPGPAGADGAPGAPGERGPPAPSLQWFDALGARVGPDPAVLAQGVRWPLNFESGALLLTTHAKAFTSADCSGPALVVLPPLPRVAFMVINEPEPKVRGDGARTADTAIGSTRNEAGVCNLASGSQPTVRLDTLMPLTLPQSPFTGPLHTEIR